MADGRGAAGTLSWVRHLPRPTRAASLLLTIAGFLELLGQLIGSKGVAIAAAAAVGAVISDAFLAPRVSFADVDRRTPLRMAVGVAAKVELNVTGSAKRASGRRPIVMKDRPPGLDIGRFVIPSIRAGERAVAERTAMPQHRGRWEDGGRIDIEAYSPLGAWVRRNRVRIAESGWVHPEPAPPLRLPEGGAGEIARQTAMSRTGSGHDFYGIREWRPGDSSTSVHWRASARRNQLVVMERERPGYPTLVIVAGRLADDQAGEELLARVAATVVQALRDTRNVVLVADGSAESVTTPIAALDWFAGLEPMSEPDTATLHKALQLAGGGATVVWLGFDALPARIATAARNAGAGSVTAAHALTGSAR